MEQCNLKSFVSSNFTLVNIKINMKNRVDRKMYIIKRLLFHFLVYHFHHELKAIFQSKIELSIKFKRNDMPFFRL